MGKDRPWWLRLDGVPPGYHERRSRKPTRAEQITACVVSGVLLVGSLAAAGWNGYADRRLAERLEQQGITVDARVVDFRSYGRLSAIRGQEAKVVFTTDQGDRIETWIVVGGSVEDGPVSVRYLRSDPEVARLSADLKPRAADLPQL